jgi:hypothetical protein
MGFLRRSSQDLESFEKNRDALRALEKIHHRSPQELASMALTEAIGTQWQIADAEHIEEPLALDDEPVISDPGGHVHIHGDPEQIEATTIELFPKRKQS